MSTAPIDVLLIEDHQAYRESLMDLLNGSGRHQARGAATAEEGLAALEVRPPQVVLMDIHLHDPGGAAGMNGIQATRAIRERWPQVQVVMCTVYEDDDKIFDALKAGATGYVLKRAPIDELFDAAETITRVKPTPCRRVAVIANGRSLATILNFAMRVSATC